MVRGVVALLLLVGACDLVFELHAPPATNPADPCGVQTFDALRYRAEAVNTNWLDSRVFCQRYGMDLVVFDTIEELEDVVIQGQPPYWIGVRGANDTTLDDCPAVLDLIDLPDTSDGCVLVRADFKMDRITCEQNTYLPAGGTTIFHLCETPRPSAECAARPVPTYTEGPKQVVGDQAGDTCAPPEINSAEDLAALEEFARDRGIGEFWLAAKYGNNLWSVPSGCPSLFRWGLSQPLVGVNQVACATHSTTEGASSRTCDSALADVICEMR